jgi:hypothetical protein
MESRRVVRGNERRRYGSVFEMLDDGSNAGPFVTLLGYPATCGCCAAVKAHRCSETAGIVTVLPDVPNLILAGFGDSYQFSTLLSLPCSRSFSLTLGAGKGILSASRVELFR